MHQNLHDTEKRIIFAIVVERQTHSTQPIAMNTNAFRTYMKSALADHTDRNGEVNMTTLAEDCANHFGLLSESGDTEPESIIFEIATEFFNN